jgi:hypothetical protein
VPTVPAFKHALSAGALLTAALCASPQAPADDATVPLFAATYAVEWHGLTAGYSTLEVKQTGPDTYTYSSRIRAHGIFLIAFPGARTQVSTFKLDNGHVLPLTYREEGGGKDEDVALEFDWDAKRARGTSEGKMVDVEIPAGTQDPLSVQIELMRDLIVGHAPERFALFDKDEAKQYDYTRERTQTLDTPLGKLDTIVYRSDRPGSDRVTRLWLAQSLGYLPVQAERERGGRVDLSLHVRELKRAAT